MIINGATILSAIRKIFFAVVIVNIIIATPINAANVKNSFREQNNVLYSGDCGTGGSSSSSAGSTSVTGSENGWVFPVTKDTPITSEFAEQREGYSHRGVDLGAPEDSPIYAARDGTVVESGPADGFGNWIIIQHDVNGKRVDSVYGHMKAKDLLVKKGDKVKAGQHISNVGNEGQSFGAHLHYEEWTDGRFAGSERKPEAVYGKSGTASGTSATTSSMSSSSVASCCPSGGGSAASGGSCGSPLPSTIPEYWRNLIDNAASKYPNSDRRAVAATLWVENRGWPDPASNWAVSGAGAAGPWQFIESSWASMGVDCNNDGEKNRNDPEDAVCAAFVHLDGSCGKPIMDGVTGDAENDWNTVPFVSKGNDTVLSAIRHYNGSGAVDGVPVAQQPDKENGHYIQMAYWLLASDFTISYNPLTKEKGDATKAGPAASGEATALSTSSSAACATADAGSTTGIPAAECGPLVEEIKKMRTEGKFRSINGEANLDNDLKNCTSDPIDCNGGVTPQLLRGFVAVVRHIDSKGLGPVEFASMNTGHGCDGKMHPQGKAVDFWNCNIDPAAEDKLCHEIFNYILTNAAELEVRQLIHNHKPPTTSCTNEGVFLCLGDHNNEVHMGF